jgi:hypothetical protein
VRGIAHPVIFREVLAGQCDELVLGRMVDHFVAYDACRDQGPVLYLPRSEIHRSMDESFCELQGSGGTPVQAIV